MEFQSNNTTPLTKENYVEAAKVLGVEPAAIRAVAVNEGGAKSGFLPSPDNRPIVLFESHRFHTETKGIYDGTNPDISTNAWIRNYGASGAHQYDRLNKAISLNREAALKSASWGCFQIMGFNYELAGCDSIEHFVECMCYSSDYQLAAFIAYIKTTNITKYLKNKDWASFALHYNGPGQTTHYAEVMSNSYEEAVNEGYNS